MDILHGIESKALALRDSVPLGPVMTMAQSCADIELAMERPLFTPAMKPLIADLVLQAGVEDIDPAALFDQVVVDKAQLTRHIRHALQYTAQITLSELVAAQPLQQGLAELVAYLQLGSQTFSTVVDEDTVESIRWRAVTADGVELIRRARMPRVIFMH